MNTYAGSRDHRHDLRPFQHPHVFSDVGQAGRERALTGVTLLTLVTMLVEVVAGLWSGSLALLADGWHMGTHALALGGAVLAYRLSRRADRHAGYAFGGWKVEVLSAYTSGLMLAAVALWLVAEGVDTLLHPRPIAYREAIGVAVVGLMVNLLSAWLLSRAGHDHDHDHDHGHAHEPGHDHDHHHAAPTAGRGRAAHGQDHNFSAAYLHVLADALTSVLAIAALVGGFVLGWRWLDPLVALLGSIVIARWSWNVLRSSARALVDATQDEAMSRRIREAIEVDGDARLADLHVWQIGGQAWSAVVTIVADRPLSPAAYRDRLGSIEGLRHLTVEVNRCAGCG